MAVMASDCLSPHSRSFRLGLPAPQSSRRRHTQFLLGRSFHDPRTPHVLESHTERAAPLCRRDDATTCSRLSLCPCSAPLSCSLQPLLKLSLLSLVPYLLKFVSIVLLLLNDRNPILEPACLIHLFFFCLYFLIEMNSSFKSLFALLSLSSQRLCYYFYLSIVSWQYQKY